MKRRGVLAGKTALIFDLDGTLVDSEAIHRAAYEKVFRAEGIDSFDYDHHLGRRTEEVIFEVLSGNGRPTDPDIVAALARRKQQEARALVAGGLATIPGAAAFVRRAAAAGFRLAIGTGASRAGALGCLEAANLRSYFAVIVTGDDVARGKPAPDIFLRDVDLLGVPGGECLVLEDAPSGVEAARAARLDSVVVVDARHRFADTGGEVAFSSYGELSGLLG